MHTKSLSTSKNYIINTKSVFIIFASSVYMLSHEILQASFTGFAQDVIYCLNSRERVKPDFTNKVQH